MTAIEDDLGPTIEFIRRLASMTSDQIASVAGRIQGARSTAADEVERLVALRAVSRDLRRLRRSRAGAIAASMASRALLASQGAMEQPRDQVVRAARAAADLARALVAGCPPDRCVLGRGWEEVLPDPLPPSEPTATRPHPSRRCRIEMQGWPPSLHAGRAGTYARRCRLGR